MTNARDEPAVGREIAAEIESSGPPGGVLRRNGRDAAESNRYAAHVEVGYRRIQKGELVMAMDQVFDSAWSRKHDLPEPAVNASSQVGALR